VANIIFSAIGPVRRSFSSWAAPFGVWLPVAVLDALYAVIFIGALAFSRAV
jgi:hypothetical protein